MRLLTSALPGTGGIIKAVPEDFVVDELPAYPLAGHMFTASRDLLSTAAWDAWVDKANTPARATVEARLASPKYLVEIMCVAAI